MRHGFPLGCARFNAGDVSCRHLPITWQSKEQRDVDVDAFADELLNGGQPFCRRRDFDENIGAIQRPPQTTSLQNRAFSVMRQVWIDFQTHISIPRVRLIVHGSELVGCALHVALGESFVNHLGALPLEGHGPDVLLIILAAGNGLLEDRWIGGHAPQSIFLDQPPQLATEDQIPPGVVQPDRLAELCQLQQGVLF